jgi:hypothetical protein
MTNLVIPGGAFDSVYTPSSGFVVTNGAWGYGWDGAEGNGSGPIKAISPQAAYVVPNWNPATIVDSNTTYTVASIKTTLDSILANDINESGGGGVVLIDAAQTGLFIKLTGDEVGGNGGYYKLKIMPLTTAVEGSSLVEFDLPAVSGSEVTLEVSYNKITQEVVMYFNNTFIGKYKYSSAPTGLRIGIGAYRGSGAVNYHTGVTTSFDAIPFLKSSAYDDTQYRVNAGAELGNITAAVNDLIIYTLSYRYQVADPLTVATPTWNSLPFTQFGTATLAGPVITRNYYLRVTSAGSVGIIANFINGNTEFNLSGSVALVYGGVASHTLESSLTQVITNGDTWAQPSLSYSSLAVNDIAVDVLNLSGFDGSDNNQVNTPFTPSANQNQILYRAPTDRDYTYAGNTYVTEVYGIGSQTATWTAGAPAAGYGSENLYYNTGFVLKAALPGSDTTPDAFTFTAQTGAALSTVTTSNTVTISGIDAASAISISGTGTYSKNGGAYTSTAGTVVNGDTVSVRITSSGSYSTAISTTLTVGGVTGTFTVTTGTAVDTTPDAFTLNAQTGVALSTVTTSNTITVAGINAASAISISGSGTYSKNGGAYTASAGTVVNGDTVAVRITSSASNSTSASTILTIGGVTSTFTVTTVAASGGGSVSLVGSAVNFYANDSYVIPGTITAGDLITMFYTQDGNSPAVPSGYTRGAEAVVSWDGQHIGYVYKLAVGNEGGTTVLFGNAVHGIFAVWTNVDQTTPVTSATTFETTTSSSSPFSIVLPTLTTTSANTMLVAIGGLELTDQDPTIVYTAPTGFTQLGSYSAVYDSVAVSYKNQAVAGASGAVTYPVTSTSIAAPGGVLFGINPGSGGGGSDTTPDAFTFTAATGSQLTTVNTSNTITVAGIDTASAISISGNGTYSKNGGAYTAISGTVVAGDTIAVRLTSSGSYSTAVTSTVTIGGVTGTYSVTTRAINSTPTAFTLTAATGSNISTVNTSNTITVAGIDAGATPAISVSGSGTYSKNGGAYTATAGTVALGDTVSVRLTSSSAYSTAASTTLTIGGVTSTYTVTTRAADTIPDAFTFTTVNSAPLSTVTESNTIIVGGLDTGVTSAISISGATAQYAISTDGGTTFGSWVATAGTVLNGYVVKVRMTSSGSAATTVTSTLTIGGVTGTFSVNTGAVDTTPDAFTFATVTGVNPSTATDSAPTIVAGVTAGTDVSITVSGGSYAISTDGGTTYGAFTTAAGNVRLGYYVKTRATSSASYSTSVTSTVTIGGVAGTFTVTTRAVDVTPSGFTFTATTNAALGSVQTSNTVTLAGFDAGQSVAISISGTGTYSKNGGAYTATAGTVVLGDTVSVRVTASNAAATLVTTTLTVGGVTGAYNVTSATPAITSVNSGTVAAGQTGVTLVTTGFSALTGVTIGGVAATALAGTGNSYTFTAVDMVDGADFPAIGSTVPVVVTNGTATATLNVIFTQRSTQDTIVLTSVPTTTIGFIGYYTSGAGAAIGDQVHFDKASVLASASSQTVPLNGVRADGSIYSDYSGAQTMYLRKASTGKIIALSVNTPNASADTTPDAFTFTAATAVTPSTVQTSNTITVAGVTAATPIAIGISGTGTYSKNGGAYTASAGTVVLGDTIAVRVTSSASYSTAVSTTVTIGGVTGTYTATTRAVDVTPDAFSMTAVTNATASTVQTSNAVIVAGIDAAQSIAISITGGTYAVSTDNGSTYGAYTASASTVQLGYYVKVQVTASATASATNTAVLTIGGVTGNFAVTTAAAADTTPDAFTFTAVTNSQLSTVNTSNTITVAGINAASAITITGGTYSKNGGAYVSSAGTVSLGDTVTVRVTSSAALNTPVSATVTIGGVTGTYTVTTIASVSTPDVFTFVPATRVQPSTVTLSNTVTISGLGAAAAISITGGTYSKNGGAYVSSAGTISTGDTVTVSVVSSASPLTTNTATLTIGTRSGTFTVRTISNGDMVADAVTFATRRGADPLEFYESNAIIFAGLSAGEAGETTISITNGQYAIDNGSGNGFGAWTSAAGLVRLGDVLKLKVQANTPYSDQVTEVNKIATLTYGTDNKTATFTVINRVGAPSVVSVNGGSPITSNNNYVAVIDGVDANDIISVNIVTAGNVSTGLNFTVINATSIRIYTPTLITGAMTIQINESKSSRNLRSQLNDLINRIIALET